MLNDCSHELAPVFFYGCLLDEDLDNAKAAVVCGQLIELCVYFIEDELALIFVETLDNVLDYMGALGVEGQSDHLPCHYLLEVDFLPFQIDHVNKLLYRMRALFVATDHDEIWPNLL